MADVRLTVNGGRPANAGMFFTAGQELLHLLDDLTDTETSEDDWIVSDLHIGSAVASLQSTSTEREAAGRRLIHGLSTIKNEGVLPRDWTPDARTTAIRLVKSIGESSAELEFSGNVVTLDKELDRVLNDIAPWTREMYGSLRGTLTGVNISRGYRASLKLQSGRIVRCKFTNAEKEEIGALLFQFVEIAGTMRQDDQGQPYFIKLDSIRGIPPAPMDWEDLFGFDEEMTDGRSASDYLAVIRGEE